MTDKLKKLAAKNPKADEAAVKAARRAVRELRRAGVARQAFRLLPAFGSERPKPWGRRFGKAAQSKMTEDA
jgi:hypothetical protein